MSPPDLTYAFILVDLADSAHCFPCANDGDCLDGDAIAEAGSFAVDDAWYVNVCLDAELLTGLDDFVVGADGLSKGSLSITIPIECPGS